MERGISPIGEGGLAIEHLDDDGVQWEPSLTVGLLPPAFALSHLSIAVRPQTQIARSFGPRRKLKRESGLQHLIAVMAQALDQDTTKALTLTAQWQSYLESRRQMEHTRKDVEKFVELMKKSDDV